MTETIPQIRARCRADIKAAVIAQRDKGITQTEAGRNLGLSTQGINNLIHRLDIKWPLKRQGRTSKPKGDSK